MGPNQTLKFVIDGDATKAKAALHSVYGDVGKLDGSLKGTFGGIVPMASVAASAILGIGTAVIVTGRALFDLGQNAAEYGSQIYDVQAKTGLAAETLSTLKLASDSAGSSFENIGVSISKFAVLVGQANQGNEKAIATLDKYGITARDLNGALEQGIKVIADETNETKQAAAAKDLFKDRAGAVIPVVKQLNGDLRQATQAAIKMGTTLGQDDIEAADALGDAIGQLSQQIKIGATKFALAYGPQITTAIGEISNELAENQDKWKQWGTVVGNILSGVKQGIVSAATFAKDNPIVVKTILNVVTAGAFGAGEVVAGELDNYGRGGSWHRNAPDPAETERNRNDPRNPFYKPPKGKEAGVFGVGESQDDDEADTTRADNAKRKRDEAARRQAEAYRRELAAQKAFGEEKAAGEERIALNSIRTTEEAFEKGDSTAEAFQKSQLESIDKWAAAARARIENAFKFEMAGAKGTEVGLAELRRTNALGEVTFGEANLKGNVQNKVDARKADLDKRDIDAAKRKADMELAIEQGKSNRALAILDSLHSQGLIKEDTYAKAVGQIKLAQLEIEKSYESDTIRRQQLEDQIHEQKTRNAAEIVAATKRQADAEHDAAVAAWDHAFAIAAQSDALKELNESLSVVNPAMQASVEVGQMFTSAISQWTQGVGDLLGAWILYGEVGPNALRKMTAQVLASVAVEAAAKALFYTAEGIAMLFFNPAASTNFFIAAGIMTGIAGSFALAGRAVAGNSFQSGSSSNGGSSGGSSSSSQNRNLDPFTRSSERAYYSGQNKSNMILAASLDRFVAKVDTVKDSEVFMSGMRKSRGAVLRQATEDARSNAGAGVRFGRAVGMR